MTNVDRRERSVQDIINLVCAALLFISPWVLGFATEMRAGWTAWISGVVLAVMALAALIQFAEWEEWVALVVGVVVALSPWVLGFATVHSAASVFTVLGVIVVLSSLSEIWTEHYHPTLPMRS